MALSFIFDAGKGETPQSVAQKRALVQQLMGTGAAPKTFGEGLSALGDGIVANVSGRRANEAESQGQAGANDTFNALTAMLTGRGGATPSAGFAGAPGAGVAGNTASPPTSFSGDQQEFVNALLPGAIEASKRTGIDPRIIVAQAAQESGWGKHAPGNNLFGIKSHGQSGGQDLWTNEEINGQNVRVKDSFRAYDSPGDSISGYADFMLQNPRYKPFMGAQGLDAQLEALGSSGYATDSNYANSVGAIARGLNLPDLATSPENAATAMAGGMPQAQPAQLPQIGPSGGPQMAAAPQQSGMVPQTPLMQPQAPMAPQQQPMQTAQGPSLQMLMEAAANPWLNEGQRGIVNSMIAQEMQRQDPAYQQNLRAGDLGIQKSELELEKLRNPAAAPIKYEVIDGQVVAINPNDNSASSIGDFGQPDPGYRLMTPAELQSVPGLDPRKAYQVGPDNKISEIGGGGVNVTVGGGPEMGKLSTDYGYVMDPATGLPKIDPETGLPQAAAVPGSPAALAQEQAAAAAAAQSGTQVTTDVEGAATTLATTRSVLDLLDNSDQPTTGTLSRPFAMYSGSPAGRVRSYVNTLQSGVALGAMQRLKEASATGATGFGALSEKELNILISNIGALDPDNTEPEIFRETVLRIEDQSKRVIADIKRNVSPERIQELGLQPLIDAFGDKPNFDYNSETAPEGWGGDASLWKFLSPEDRALW